MSQKTLKFENTRLNKKEFHNSKEPFDLMSVIVSDKFKNNNEGKTLSILLVTKKMELLNHYVLFYLK